MVAENDNDLPLSWHHGVLREPSTGKVTHSSGSEGTGRWPLAALVLESDDGCGRLPYLFFGAEELG